MTGDRFSESEATLRRRLDEATRRAESLRRVIEAISGELAPEPLLTRIVESAVELIGADDGAIGLVVDTPAGPAVRIAALCNLPPQELGALLPADIGLAGRVLREKRPVALDRYGDLEWPTLPALADNAVLGVPIWWAGRMIGFFGIGVAPPRRFDDHAAETLTLFARHAAIAIENARRYEEERRRTEQLALIARVSRIITADLMLDDLLQSAADAIHELLGYPNIAIALIDPDDTSTMVAGTFGGSYRALLRGKYRLPISEGIMGAAARERQTVLVNNVAADPRYYPAPGVAGAYAELAVPIEIGDQLLGILNVESADPLAEADAASLQIIADQLATAIENARQFESEQRRAARIATINRIGSMITSRLSLDDIFQTAVQAIHEQLHFAYVAAGAVDPDDPETLVLLAQAGATAAHLPADYRQSIHEGLIGAAARSRQQVLVNDVAADPRYLALVQPETIRAELVVPIVSGDRLLGVLNIESRQRISAADAEGAAIIADQLAIAMENAALFTSTQRTLSETHLLYETSQRISSALSVDEVIAAYLEHVAARHRYACGVMLYEFDIAGRRSARVLWGSWSPQDGLVHREERLPYSVDPLVAPLDSGQTITIADIRGDERISATFRSYLLELGWVALAMIPLIAPDQRIGLVWLSHPGAYAWSETDLHPYQVTAALLAAAIDNRRQHLLLAERGQQLAVLEERRRLARELHDSVTQSLFSMSLLAQVLPDLWEVDPAESRAGLLQIRDLTRSALAEMRALLFELRPAALGERELAHAIRHQAAEFERRTGIPVTIDIDGDPVLPEAIEQAFFRIAQEALANVARHARARKVYVYLHGGPPARLLIADDGQGFQPGGVQAGRFGLVSMRERAANIGARLEVRSSAGQGAEIVVEWPTTSDE